MKLNIQRALAATSLALIAALATGCAAPPRGYERSYERSAERGYRPVPSNNGSQAYAQYGAVASIDPLRGARQTSGGGAIVGGLVGALLGHQMSSGGEKAAATAIGVVGGAFLGNEIEKNQGGRSSAEGWRVLVRFDNGGQRAFDYASLNELRVGDRVRVVNNEVYRD